eukprot:UN27007
MEDGKGKKIKQLTVDNNNNVERVEKWADIKQADCSHGPKLFLLNGTVTNYYGFERDNYGRDLKMWYDAAPNSGFKVKKLEIIDICLKEKAMSRYLTLVKKI